ncbi:FecR family protein [Azomonas agilis]|uniref:FecR family protein n=1 Tax=Azomonas agilis TaxID=116849 RepID=A0A562IYS0_9GAMM|nr:FecR family protein [Azomonas agilis]TWH76032.1 FecR family protein [Azomonas agilis]
MNTQPPSPDDDTLLQEAADWCMRLHAEDCNEEDRQAFQQWMLADPRHAEEYLAILDIWALSEHLPRQNPPTPTYSNTPVTRPSMPVRRRRRPALRAAVVLLLVLPIAGYSGWMLGWLPNDYHNYQTEQRLLQVSLPDGSDLELNLETRLRFTNYRDQRQIELDKGEAYFHVQHDRDHPFVVKVGTSSITVTGTQFNILRYQDNVVVTVTEGSVRVRTAPQYGDSNITPGLQASYRQGDPKPHIAPVDTGKSLAWREGKLILDDLSLAQALPLINRYLDTPLELADSSVANLRIGGIYNTQELAGIVDILPQVLPIQISRAAGHLLIKSCHASL